MAFLVNCIIHDSTPRIWRILSEIGLKRDPLEPEMKESTKREPRCVAVIGGYYFSLPERAARGCWHDCGRDERLFFALAALRNDTDQDQVFIYDDRDCNDEKPMRFWFRCSTPNVADDVPYGGKLMFCQKATPSELIYHFGGMDDDMCHGDNVKPKTSKFE